MNETQNNSTVLSENDNCPEKLAFFEKYFRELFYSESHRMERIENKSARLLSATSIIIVVLGWQIQNNNITQHFNLFMWINFVLMITFLLISWFYFFQALDFVDIYLLDVNKKLNDDILDEKYRLEDFHGHAVEFYCNSIEKNGMIIDKKVKRATKASFFAKLTFLSFCLLLFNILIDIIEKSILMKG